MKLKTFLLTSALCITGASVSANLLITQYYEGSSFDKYIELTNTGSSTIDFSVTNFFLSLWSNANTEGWKTDGGSASSEITLNSGSVSAGGSYVVAHGSAANPSYVTPDLISSSVANFNGDDSVVLYSDNTGYATANILDAISFTDAGSEGANTSITRLTADVGYNTTAGSTFEDFASVWSEIGTSAADSALAGTEERLGFSAISSIPEPSVAAMLLIGMGFLFRFMRKK